MMLSQIVYLAGCTEDAQRLSAAREQLAAAGYRVLAPCLDGGGAPDTLDALADQSRCAVDALINADVVVTLPGAADTWETAVSATLGIPHRSIGQLVSSARTA